MSGAFVVRLVCLSSLWMSSIAGADAKRVENASLSVELPDGYRDVTQQVREQGFPRPQLAFEAISVAMGFQPTILIQHVPVYGGSFGDPVLCAMDAHGIAEADQGTVKTTAIIQSPVGPTCQISIVFPQAAALLTELNGASETWLMTCNYADGDQAGERACRAVLASLRPTLSFGRPDPVAQERARIFARIVDPFAFVVYTFRSVLHL